MNESSDSSPGSTPRPDSIRTEEPQPPYGAGEVNPSVASDETVEEAGEHGAQDEALPDTGGYGDRDPKTEMPAVPAAPETQGEAPTHEGQPDDKEPGAHE